jgi:TolA-binding protein
MKQIVPNDKCLTQDQILRYLRDECQASEVKAIDKHLTHCPMCSDALEGAMMMDDKALESSYAHVEAFISEKTNEILLNKTPLKVVRTPTRYLRTALIAAASVAALAAASIWLFTKPLDSASNTESKIAAAPTESIQAADSAYFAQTPNVVEEKAADAKPIQKLEKDFAQSNEPLATATNEVKKPITPPSNAAPKDDIAQASEPAPTTKAKEIADKMVMSDQANAEKEGNNREEVQAKQETYKAQKMEQAAAPKAAKTMSKAKANNSDEVDIKTLNKGISFFQVKDYDKAISAFNSILAQQSEGELYEKALWYSANAYFQNKNKTASKAVYQRIAKEKGSFATQAETILKNWKD